MIYDSLRSGDRKSGLRILWSGNVRLSWPKGTVGEHHPSPTCLPELSSPKSGKRGSPVIGVASFCALICLSAVAPAPKQYLAQSRHPKNMQQWMNLIWTQFSHWSHNLEKMLPFNNQNSKFQRSVSSTNPTLSPGRPLQGTAKNIKN